MLTGEEGASYYSTSYHHNNVLDMYLTNLFGLIIRTYTSLCPGNWWREEDTREGLSNQRQPYLIY